MNNVIKQFIKEQFPVISRLFAYVKPYKRAFIISIVLALLMAAFSPIRPYLIQLTIDSSTAKQHTPKWFSVFNSKSITEIILAVTVFQVIFIFIETAIRFAFSFITASMGQKVVKDLRVTVFDKILKLPLSSFDTTPIGTLSTRTINDIESINEIFSDGLIPIIADLLTIVFTLTMMFWIDWRLTLISLIPFPILIISTYYFKESVKKSFIKVRNAVANLNSFVQEHLTGINIIQSFTAEEKEFNKFKEINAQHRNANIKAIFAYSIFFPIIELVLAISTALIVWWVAHSAIEHTDNTIEFSGKIVAFVLFMSQIFRPLRVIADKFNVLQMGIIAAERVFGILNMKDEKENHSTTLNSSSLNNIQPAQGQIDFKQVWFAYSGDNYVLKNISFTVQPGQTLAIVGQTGSGKTSIISLLNKLYPLNQGKILVNNTDIETMSLEELRKNIGVVLQDVFLFSGSVLENITLRNSAISKQQVIEAAKLIGLHDFIMKLPNDYDYNVMERGATLSLGQRQLISFIRAILYNPSILILDEATSSIDTESEQLIQHAIDTLITGRTSIVIAHRLSTIRKAHTIMVMEKGEIKEMGNHQQLMQLGGMYYTLQQKHAEV